MPTIPFLGALFSSQPKDMTDYPIKKGEDEWLAQLSPEAFRVIRQKETQMGYKGTFDKHMPGEGAYVRHLSCPYSQTSHPDRRMLYSTV